MRLIRNLTNSDLCPRCQVHREDMHHLLRGCFKAKAIWLHFKSFRWWQRSINTPLQIWLKANLRSKDHVNNIQWSTVFLTSLWLIWKERNKIVFDNLSQPVHLSVNLILKQALEIQEAFQSTLNPRFRNPILMLWSFPIPGKLKLNTDGSSKGDPSQLSYGGLLRDEVGTWLWGYIGYLGNCTSLEAELWGIYRGLTIIMQKGLAHVEIETDSQTAMALIRDGAEANSLYQALIEDASFLLRRCQCSIKAIPREANHSADALANLRVNQQEYTVFLDDPPNTILPLLITDMCSASSSRA